MRIGLNWRGKNLAPLSILSLILLLPILLVRVRDHAIVHIRPAVAGLIIVRPVIVIVLVIHIEGLGTGGQGTNHCANGQTRYRAHRSPSRSTTPTTATAVISPTATAAGDADITGVRNIYVLVVGVVMAPPVIMMAPTAMVTAPGTAAMAVPKAAAAEATIMTSAPMIAIKAPTPMRATEAAPTPAAATPTPGLGLLREKGEAEN